MVYVGGQEHLVHRLVAFLFIGDPPSQTHTVDHIDRNPQNNDAENLRWASRSEQNTNKEKRVSRRESPKVELTAPDGTIKVYETCCQAADAIGTSYVNICQAARTGWKTNGGYKAKYIAPEPQEIEGEVWKVSVMDPTLKVSTLGRIQRKYQRGDAWGFRVTPQPTRDQQGYVKTLTGKVNTAIHYVVMLTFVGPSDDPQKTTIDHINRIRHDNRLCNLRWATRQEQLDNRDMNSKSFNLQ